ncbi:hypothetical protein [Streptomyces sulphureus]|uniref:hypothetical protein n=1 Tax=Streptomyces sulphureus TaxID=47758 RepID=UPI000379EFDE|nr:hypothetical protein [Streptomyces sulphureus]
MTAEKIEGQLLDGVVRNAWYEALQEVWHRYEDLVQEQTHEVTVMAKVAAELQPRIDDALEHRYRVDVEYNRWHGPNAREFRVKYLPDPSGENKRVRPDLIVHDGTGNHLHNLLVVEAKQGAQIRPRDREDDYRKLLGFLSVYDYRQAVYLEFDGNGGPPRLEWLRQDEWPDPEYRPAEVVALF